MQEFLASHGGWNWSNAMACDVEVFPRPKSPTGEREMAMRASKSKAQFRGSH
jgi:hypothetical protein